MNRKEELNVLFDPIADALAAIRNGECIVVVDDESRENEGDLICAAQFATPQQINFMAKEGRGLICLAMDGERLDQLDLPLMVDRNTDSNETAFTVSIDAGPEYSVSTGISAEDRARTIQVAISPNTKPNDLRRPGHIFPLRAKKGGVLKRAGHTEAAVDLAQLSGLSQAGVICEIQNADGSMARLPELRNYAKKWQLKIISIADLIKYRLENERFVFRMATTKLPSIFGDFEAIGYSNKLDGTEHIALVKGTLGKFKEPVLVRMHSECLTGDAFGSLRCDCRPQLEAALSRVTEEGEGIVVYLRQEGRGIGLINKLKAYSLQDGGLDTVEANERLGFPADLRNYGVGAQILTDLGIQRLRLLTNNPRKIAGLGGYGLKVESREPLVICPGDHNADYLYVKRTKLGHFIDENYQYESNNYYVIYWDGTSTNNNLSVLKNNAEAIAREYQLKLSPENSPRLLALWERPNFVWRVDNCKDINSIYDLLLLISNWEGTNRVGIFSSNNKQQAIHPSQNLENNTYTLNDLKDKKKEALDLISKKKLPYIITWK
ncbi:bifunctional 3,4-dihydroxy-2-butanone-4-phosphate synthase/GTP cyclohydrolase II [Prochlorococcus marinus]|uniref:bifunctional 3,4-dihydroxy-2-butanone-4-phosphate synthase/GTP cyclohydrolase II n=1 Tax=Prochlorococcus marinus TaxID=1219 RepID=UPI0022B3C24D|nr:bifunctional 3,4-dihydroxy-2-butanone-4-phosphate synthase/GTP cyclohydrolase II [Prochlorococcus marinus]